jgi:hypothetical protein
MRCEKIKELILEHRIRDLDQSEKLKLDTHLGECKECDSLFRHSNEVWNLLDKWESIEPREGFLTEFWNRVLEEDTKKKESTFDFFRNWKLIWAPVAALTIIVIVSVISLDIFQPKLAEVVFTAEDEEDEKLLIELDRAISRETAESLDIYGPWNEEIEENNKGG